MYLLCARTGPTDDILSPCKVELYTDSECQNLATNASNVCVSDVKSYIGRRRDGN